MPGLIAQSCDFGYCISASAGCGEMNPMPPSLLGTRSPGIAAAPPMRTGTSMPIMVEFIRAPAERLFK
jgi:hypothetical protein